MRRWLGTTSMIVLMAVFLVGCAKGNETANQMHDHLEKAVGIEQGFIKYQKQLIQKEKKEQDLYNKIAKLPMDQFDVIKTKSKQASQLAGDRKQLIQKEKKIMDLAYKEFVKVKPLASKLRNVDQKEKAKQMIQEMDQRHNVFSNLYNDYIKSIDLDQKLYEMLENKNVKEEQLSAQVKKINDLYSQIDKEKQRFNHLTESYNKAKKEFYKSAGIK